MRSSSSKNMVVFLVALAMLAGVLLPFSLAPPAGAAVEELNWVDARGPGNGDAMAMVYDNVHGILYRGTVGSGGSVGQSGKGVWKYQAGTWTSLGGEVAALGINTLAYDSAGDRLYAGSNGRGVWCYNPSAGTWSETNVVMRAYYITSLAFGGGKLYAGVWDPNGNGGLGAGLGVWSYNPGPPGTWTIDTGSVSTFRIEALAFGGGKLYAGCIDRSAGEIAKGVWCYDPATTTWTDTGGDMANRYSRVLTYDAVNDLLYSSAGFTGVFCYDPDSSETNKWTNTAGAAGFYEVTSLAWGEGKLYAGCNSMGPIVHNVVLCYDPLSGETDKWTDTGGDMAAYQFPSLAYDTVHHYLYVGTTRNGVWRYDLSNAPPTWGDTRGGVSTSYILSLAYDTVDDLLYVGTINEGVWCYNPATATWTDTGGAASTFQVFSLAWGGGKLYASCYDLTSSTYVGVWCYDPLSPNPDKWTDTGGTEKAISSLVYDAASDLLYAGTGEYYSDSNGHGVWCYDPTSSGWSDISSGDIDTFKIDSMALGGDGRLYAGCYNSGSYTYLGVWYYDLDNPGLGWSNTGGSVSTFTAYSLAWGGDKLYAGCLDKGQPIVDWGQGVWCYDPTIPAPDKWTNTGGGVSNFAAYSLAWGEGKLYASCLNGNTQGFDGVWGYDPASPDADKWTDTAGGVSSYYISSLLYDDGYHRLYAGSGGMGAWYYGASPVIDALDPAAAAVGSEVTINGSSFGPGDSGSEYVTFGGVPAVVKPGTWTDDSVVCYVPAGISATVPVIVHNLNGASNQADFTVAAPRTTFYFAEGYTGPGFQEYLCLGNPADQPVSVDVTYITNGPEGPGHITTTYDVPALSRFTADVNAEVGPGLEVSIKAESTSGFVAERPLYFDYGGGWTGGSDTVGATGKSTVWYFAEGYTGEGFDEYICVLNDGDAPATLTFRFQTQEAGEKTFPGLSVGANSRATYKVNDMLGGAYQTSLKLESNVPVVAERPMYFDYQGTGGWGWTGGHDVLGAPALARDYYFSEGTTRAGFEEWLTLQNPGTSEITVHAEYQLASGAPVSKDYKVPAGSRRTIFVAGEVGTEQDVSVYLHSAADFLAERPMYFDYSGFGADWTGGHCVIGATSPGTEWFFAEGYTGPGFQEWLTLQNPGAEDAAITVTYYPESGGPITRKHNVPARSRYNVFVNGDAGENLSICTRVVSSRPIIAERPMYFNYQGAWTGGHDVVGYTP